MSIRYKTAIKRIEELERNTPLLIRNARMSLTYRNRELLVTKDAKRIKISTKAIKSAYEGHIDLEQITIAPIDFKGTIMKVDFRGGFRLGITIPEYTAIDSKGITFKGWDGENDDWDNKPGNMRLDVVAGKEDIINYLESRKCYKYAKGIICNFLGFERAWD